MRSMRCLREKRLIRQKLGSSGVEYTTVVECGCLMRKLLYSLSITALLVSICNSGTYDDAGRGNSERFLYVACPGIQDILKWGGHGVLVFDIDHEHRFVKRIDL